MMGQYYFSLLIVLCMGCNQNHPHVYFDLQKKLLYVDSIDQPDVYIYAATAFDGKESVENFPVLVTPAVQHRQYSLQRHLDSLGMKRFSLDITLKKDPLSFFLYYAEVYDSSVVVIELTPTVQ